MKVVFTAVLCCCGFAFGIEEKYTTKFDNVNFEEIIHSERLLKNYVNCLLDKGSCTPDGKELKRNNLFANDNELLEDDFKIIDIINYGFPRRIYQRADFFEELDEMTFFRRFRLSRATVHQLLLRIEDQLEYEHDLNNSVSPINQLLTVLRFYASAGHLSSIGDFVGMHTSTASRIVAKVSRVIATLAPAYIKTPTPNECLQIQNEFFNTAKFPRVIGCLDGTHIRIQSPGGNDAEIYRNRKGYFSINTQVWGDSNLKVRNIVARWPGSAHDNTIYNNSRVRAELEGGYYPNCVILGDSGYALSNVLMTPVPNPLTRGQQLFHEAQIRTRNSIERLFGVWKRRFPVLAYGLCLKLDTVLAVIVATAVLHNIAIDAREDVPPPPEEIDIDQLNYLIETGEIPAIENNVNDAVNFRILRTRNNLINYFDNR